MLLYIKSSDSFKGHGKLEADMFPWQKPNGVTKILADLWKTYVN